MKRYALVFLLVACAAIVQAQTADTAKTITAVDHAATYPGGLAKLYSFIAANIKYPEAAKKANLQGKVLLRFFIDTNGAVTDVRIIQGLSPEINTEAVRLIKSTSNWIPGTHNGKLTRMMYTIPITFTLQ